MLLYLNIEIMTQSWLFKNYKFTSVLQYECKAIQIMPKVVFIDPTHYRSNLVTKYWNRFLTCRRLAVRWNHRRLDTILKSKLDTGKAAWTAYFYLLKTRVDIWIKIRKVRGVGPSKVHLFFGTLLTKWTKLSQSSLNEQAQSFHLCRLDSFNFIFQSRDRKKHFPFLCFILSTQMINPVFVVSGDAYIFIFKFSDQFLKLICLLQWLQLLFHLSYTGFQSLDSLFQCSNFLLLIFNNLVFLCNLCILF